MKRLQSLGEILVGQGRLTSEALSEAVAKFLAEGDFSDSQKAATRSQLEGPSPRPVDDFDNFSPAEKTLCYLYCRHFNESRYASFLELSENSSRETLARASKDLTAIRTATTLIRATRSKELIEKLQSALENSTAGLQKDMAIDKGIRLLWELRECFSVGIPESLALRQDASLLNRMNETIKSL